MKWVNGNFEKILTSFLRQHEIIPKNYLPVSMNAVVESQLSRNKLLPETFTFCEM